MGYTTEFEGEIVIEPPLNAKEIEYLKEFSETRRMHRKNGPYYCGTGFAGQDQEEDIINYNTPPPCWPSLWCGWEPNDDGTAIQWNGTEKFYESAQWMKCLIEHFLAPGALAQSELPFLQANHVLNGEIEAQGEEHSDRWTLIVTDNKVYVQEYVQVAIGLQEI